MKNLVIMICTVLMVTGCGMQLETSTPSPRATAAVKKYGAKQIIADATTLVQNNKTTNLVAAVSSAAWPKSISDMKPKSVELRGKKVTIILNDQGRWQNGVHVYAEIPKYIEDRYAKGGTYISGGSGYGEYKIESGISWFWVKKR